MERSVRVWRRRRRRGRGKGCPAGSWAAAAAAAASGSPREQEVRAKPGGGSSGWGRRRRTLHSHRELRAAASGRHTLARRARLSVGAAGCARLRRRPEPLQGAPLRSKLLWQRVANCSRRRAGCGPGRRAVCGSLFCCLGAFPGRPLEMSEESEVLRFRGGAPRRVGIPEPPPASWSWRGDRDAGEERASLCKPQRKVWLFASFFRRSPRRSRAVAAAGGKSRGAGRATGMSAGSCFSWPGCCLHPSEWRAEVTGRPAGRSDCAQPCGTKPTQSLSCRARGQTITFARIPPSPERAEDDGAGLLRAPSASKTRERRRGARSPGRALRSVPATRSGPARSPATCRDASISLKRGREKGSARARAGGTSPMTTSENLPDAPAAASLAQPGYNSHARCKAPTESQNP